MLILVIMMLGVIIGMKLNLKKTLKVNGASDCFNRDFDFYYGSLAWKQRKLF